MLSGKKFPQNTRALRLTVEELLRETFTSESIHDYECLMSILEEKANASRTAKLWLDALVKPVFIMMKFLRAAREADWPLYIWVLKMMLPYFAAARHLNYFRYGIAYLNKMSQLPPDLVERFMKEEHAMRHQPGLWNSIWSDMMIETTVMRYGHGPTGVKGITLNEKALDVWALSLHITTQLEQDFLSLKDYFADTTVVAHKEEGRSRIKSDAVDRDNIRKSLENCLHPFRTSTHPKEIVNIYTGKLSMNL